MAAVLDCVGQPRAGRMHEKGGVEARHDRAAGGVRDADGESAAAARRRERVHDGGRAASGAEPDHERARIRDGGAVAGVVQGLRRLERPAGQALPGVAHAKADEPGIAASGDHHAIDGALAQAPRDLFRRGVLARASVAATGGALQHHLGARALDPR